MIRLDVTPESAKWGYSGLRVVELAAGESYATSTGDDEVIVVPLSGAVTVTADGQEIELQGRASVFDGPTDVAYIPIKADLSLTSHRGGRFALATARATKRHSVKHVTVDQVRVELRGAGNCSRQVNNFGTPDVLDADRIIACEVLTPGGNWSSYPPHKHDDAGPHESELEEIYYYEGGPGYQRVYGTEDRPVDVLEEVRTGDVVLIPHGWHGPSMAAPGFDLYYLNVMAGPGERLWLIQDDPEYAWIRDTWADQEIDPRLPYRKEAR
ncbi:5-deoxy-glucuronate isomerase [Actinoplanes rectilineatus]|uniref:5-deoxy-glucuronate isomerase n=1 Tax=Actinoplanes rectilineatus TaxID=113571 RepID=UPI0005F2AA4E|nr:5-deoxy-glucuronate isomerase [Actinoplanes rectilineatus]